MYKNHIPLNTNSSMKRYLIISFLFICTVLNAQEKNISKEEPDKVILCGLFAASDYVFLSNNSLNNHLSSNNFYTLKDVVNLGSFGIYYKEKGKPLTHKLYLAYNHNLIFFSNSYTKLNIFLAGIECSYDLMNLSIWNVEPYAGIMIVNNNIMAVSKTERSSLSGNALEEVFQSRGVLILNLGLYISRTFNYKSCNLTTGLRGAYNIDLIRNSWFNNTYQYSGNMPKLSFSAFTIGLVLQVDCDLNKIICKK